MKFVLRMADDLTKFEEVDIEPTKLFDELYNLQEKHGHSIIIDMKHDWVLSEKNEKYNTPSIVIYNYVVE